MIQIETHCEKINFADRSDIPNIDVRFGACRSYPDGQFFDLVDCQTKTIERWFTPPLDISQSAKRLLDHVKGENFPGNADFFVKEMLSTHVVQVSPQGKWFINRGNFLNGTSFTVIDTKQSRAHVMIEEEGEPSYFYTCTGGFSPDYSLWYFMRWPLMDTVKILNREAEDANCEIGVIELDTGNVKILGSLRNDDRVHQITPSPDGRYLVFTSFKSDQHVPYPRVPLQDDPEGYRRSHNAGIISKSVVTVDLQTWKHWRTEVPIPVSAHMEFDLVDPSVFYVSGHNFSINCQPNVIIEGSGAIIKMKIEEGRTPIIGMYHPDDLYRVSQHVPFLHEGRTIIAITNTPNCLDLVYGDTMQLWRREELFDSEPLDFRATGSCVSPMPSKAFFSINPSTDGKYIVLESSESFHFYSTNEARFLDVTLSRHLPENAKGTGHTRIVGR